MRDAQPEPLVSRMRVNHAMILNLINQRADPVAAMRALLEDNHEDERGRRRLSEQARSLTEELLASGVLERLEPDAYGRTLQLAPALQDDFALNQPLASFALAALRPAGPGGRDLRARRRLRRGGDPRRPVPVLMAQAVQGARRGGRRDEGRRHRVRGAHGAARGGHLAAAAGRAARAGAPAVPRDAPVGARVRPLAEVGRARHVRVGADVHRVHRLLRRRPLGGAGPALPQRRLPGAAPDRARADPDRGARRPHRVARRDRPPDRLQPARRVGGADRPGRRRPRARPPPRASRCRRRARSPPTSGPSA